MNYRLVLISALAVTLSGCATIEKTIDGQRQRSLQEERLESSVEYLVKGNPDRAASILETVVADKGVPGVTDEALFRLALLTLPSEFEREELNQSTKLLERLQNEYPMSPWAVQASPLTDLLSELPRRLQAASELRRQVKTLKDLNLSLTRENKELRLNIEKLKVLDLELERKK
jgi:hypothetical protein